MDEAPLERPEALQEADLDEYGQSLGLDLSADPDLSWVVQEAFNAPLPHSWTEHTDDENRVYFFHEASNASTWEHPMDAVYRELLGLVLQVRSEASPGQDSAAVVHGHLREVHQRALKGLEGWSGPYSSPDGGEYYYNKSLKISTWENPMLEWEQELTIRLGVLSRCLLPPGASLVVQPDGSVGVTMQGDGAPKNPAGPDLLAALKLPLGLVRRDVGKDGQPDTPNTQRSFHTARSQCSSRRSGREHRDPARSPATSKVAAAPPAKEPEGSGDAGASAPQSSMGALREMD